jgi:dTDP-4-amino-4,6-dideoxygalactose transaminase
MTVTGLAISSSSHRLGNSASAPIPFLDLVAPHTAIEDQLVAVFRNALRTGAFVGGAEVEAFEREFATWTDTPFAAGVANGTDSLRFILQALGVSRGDEVITTAHTFIATSEAISQAGGIPVFVDIDPVTMTIDPAAVENAISARTVGIVPVHLYGQPADMRALMSIAERYQLFVVEDAAQAHGARHGGKRVGSIGVAGSFSFYPGKNLGSLGEGGAVTTADVSVLTTVRQLREHGQREKYVHVSEGYNSRLHAIQAAFLRIKLHQLDEATQARRRVAQWYAERLSAIPQLTLPQTADDRDHVWHLYVVRTPGRDALRQALTHAGIGTGLHYPVPLHRQECYAHLGYAAGSLPVAEQTAATLLSLPIFPTLRRDQVDRIASVIRAHFGC